jgi:LPXTG-motif cell wall-anchored protein
MRPGALTASATVASPGVPAPRRIAAVAVSLAVALVPAAARAQDGAGDEQYTDPFAGQSQPKPKAKPKPTTVQPVPHQQLPSKQTTPQPATSAQQPAASAQQPAASRGELPRTGFDVVPVALVGVALVLAGLALRRRAAHGRD